MDAAYGLKATSIRVAGGAAAAMLRGKAISFGDRS
jgi:hypothetical protein